MKKLPRKFRDSLIFLSLLITVPSVIYFISMNFGDQRIHIEKKQWNPAEAADLGIEKQLLKRPAEYIESRLPTARGMVIIRNGRTVHEKYYSKGGPEEKDFLHSLNGPILHALVGIAVDQQKIFIGSLSQEITGFGAEFVRDRLDHKGKKYGHPHPVGSAEAGGIEEGKGSKKCSPEGHQGGKGKLPFSPQGIDQEGSLCLCPGYPEKKGLTALHKKQEDQDRSQQRYNNIPVLL